MLVVFIYHLQCLRKITYIHKYQLSHGKKSKFLQFLRLLPELSSKSFISCFDFSSH